MSTVDHVTDFKLQTEDGKEQVRISDLVTAVGVFCREFLEGETFCCPAAWDDKDARIPKRFRWLVAFAVEGENEADYVHFGALVQKQTGFTGPGDVWGDYVDFGFAKVWCGPAKAREIANQVQRFLNAARWN